MSPPRPTGFPRLRPLFKKRSIYCLPSRGLVPVEASIKVVLFHWFLKLILKMFVKRQFVFYQTDHTVLELHWT